jgi:hypothetical protein
MAEIFKFFKAIQMPIETEGAKRLNRLKINDI